VSAELDRGIARVFGSAGYFSRGIWFAGVGAGVQASPRVAVSVAFSRAWAPDAAGTLARDRREISGGAAVSLTPRIAIFGSLGTTIATTDDNGAGTTVGGGDVHARVGSEVASDYSRTVASRRTYAFANRLSRRNWIVQIELQPDPHHQIAVLQIDDTFGTST